MAVQSKTKFLRFWFPVILYSGIIFLVSSIPDMGAQGFQSPVYKIAHVVEYIPFGFLVARALAPKKHLIFWGAFAALLYGLSDEFHQTFVPGRYFEISDIVADVIGAAIGAYICQLYINRQKK